MGVTKRRVHTLVKQGKLPHLRIGSAFRFRPADLDAYQRAEISAPSTVNGRGSASPMASSRLDKEYRDTMRLLDAHRAARSGVKKSTAAKRTDIASWPDEKINAEYERLTGKRPGGARSPKKGR
jgi:excisionase family DNA binding protein